MSKDLLDVLNAYGIPGWAAVMIGAGTIIAALVTSINALIVASINARASRYLAIDTAHREHRQSIVEPIRRRLTTHQAVASQAYSFTPESHEAAMTMVNKLAEELVAIKRSNPGPGAVPPDKEVLTGLWLFDHRLVAFFDAVRALRSCEPSQYLDRSASLRTSAAEVIQAVAATEAAIEAYVYRVRSARRRARRLIRFKPPPKLPPFIEDGALKLWIRRLRGSRV